MSRFEGREIRYKALDVKVLAVAIQGGLGTDWAAYIGSVPGENHEKEWQKVADDGSKMSYGFAKKLFPNFDSRYKWRP